MSGMIGSNQQINQPAGKVLTYSTSIEKKTWSEPSEQVNLGNKSSSEGMGDINRLSAFAQASKKNGELSTLIDEAVTEQTVDPSLLKSDDEAWKKGVETYLYNTDRTLEDVYPFSKKGEAKPEAEMDEWQKGMAEYRARWD